MNVGIKRHFPVVENPQRGGEAQAEPRVQPTSRSQAERETGRGWEEGMAERGKRDTVRGGH